MIATIHINGQMQSGIETTVWFELDKEHDGVRLQVGVSEPVIISVNDLLRIAAGLSQLQGQEGE